MKETGRSIIFITHKLEEVMQVADRVTAFRAGRVAATADKTDVTSRQLASLMVGKELLLLFPVRPHLKPLLS